MFVLRIAGAIGPATAEYMSRSLDQAAVSGAQLVVLQIDTPGGLDTSMRSIIKDILASPVPVAAYVAPQGARAASAGTYILYASHVAAMAPATNLGAATPVAIGLPSPGREPEPAGRRRRAPPRLPRPATTRRAPSASTMRRPTSAASRSCAAATPSGPSRRCARRSACRASDAARPQGHRPGRHRHRAICCASSTAAWCSAAIPRRGSVKLATAHAAVVMLEPDWRNRLLAVISDPSLALILMMIGIYGLLFEFMNPGFVAPGVIGGVALLLALWGLQMLPVNYAGVALILLGIAFFVAEAFLPSYGALGIGGVAAFAFGALLLIDSDMPGFGIPLSLIVAADARLGRLRHRGRRHGGEGAAAPLS